MYKIILVDNIEDAMEALMNIDGIEVQTEEQPVELNKTWIVDEKLRDMGIPAHIKGYTYLSAALVMAWENPGAVSQVTKVLYPEIAKKFGTTSSRVERAIRHAIEVAWDRGDTDKHYEVFGYTVDPNRGRPTNSEFIAAITNRLRLEYC